MFESLDIFAKVLDLIQNEVQKKNREEKKKAKIKKVKKNRNINIQKNII